MWSRGDVVLVRDVWGGREVWIVSPMRVVVDDGATIALYLAEGTPFGFPPSAHRHPWRGRGTWSGHGTLIVHDLGAPYSIWHFWDRPERAFAGWYVNFQEPWRRTVHGFDGEDHELDIWVAADGTWEWKDVDVVEERVREGRFDAGKAAEIRAAGDAVAAALERGTMPWSREWRTWESDPHWPVPELPEGWDVV